MHTQIQESPPVSPTKSVRNPNTGFPEPFHCDRNTTLTHPDADTSLGATIEASDLGFVKTKSRRTFYGRKGAKVNSFGKISLEDAGLYDDIQYADGSKEKRSFNQITAENGTNGATPTDGQSMQNGAVGAGLSSSITAQNGITPIPSARRDSSGSPSRDKEKKAGFLRRWHSHRQKS